MTAQLIIPTVHRNGTAASDLLDARFATLGALHAAGDALALMAPNARDYYVQAPNAYGDADRQHCNRLETLRGMIADVTAEVDAIQDAIA
jgi:hypothetical protein